MKNISIKDLTIPDLEILLPIERQVSDSPWTENLIKGCLEKPNYYNYGIISNSDLVGYLLCQVGADECHIMNIAIDTRYRRQGLAKQLLTHAVQIIPAAQFILEVRRDNTAAIALYASLDFQLIGERKNYYRQGAERDALVLRFITGCSDNFDEQGQQRQKLENMQ